MARIEARNPCQCIGEERKIAGDHASLKSLAIRDAEERACGVVRRQHDAPMIQRQHGSRTTFHEHAQLLLRFVAQRLFFLNFREMLHHELPVAVQRHDE